MKDNYKNYISFFIQNPVFFKQLVSTYYPIKNNQLIKYKGFFENELIINNTSVEWDSEILNFFDSQDEWKILSTNPSVFKDIRLIDEFFDNIHWQDPSQSLFSTIANNYGINWTSELIEKHKTSWDYYQLSYNPYVPWTEKLIDEHLDDWDWGALSGNPSLPWSLDFISKYSSKIVTDNFFFQINPALTSNFDIVQNYGHLLSWPSICANQHLPWIEKDLLELWKDKIDWNDESILDVMKERLGFKAKNLEKHLSANSDFDSISYNEIFPWSIPLIDKYLDFWDWNALSLNPKLPWNEDFIDYYADRLHWGKVIIEKVIYDEEGNLLDYETSMTYKNYFDDKGLEGNEGVNWSLDLILRFENRIDMELLVRNKSVWEKAFKPFIDDKLIDTVMRIL